MSSRPEEKSSPWCSPAVGPTPQIDPQRCTGCGQCLVVCPKETLVLRADQAAVAGQACMGCGHCVAACPAEAIRLAGEVRALPVFRTFRADPRWLPHGRFDTAALVNLMGSRRSCRRFADRPVPREMLEDLVQVGLTAPSGCNCQPWTFTLLPDRRAVIRLADQVGQFFRRTNRLAEKPWLRRVLAWLGRPELDTYYRLHYATVQQGLAAWAHDGRDLLFHGATAAMVVAADRQAACPAEDALLATGQILLAAHAMGLGTCLVGFAIEAMRRAPEIVRGLGIPAQERPHAAIAVGWPTETYCRVTVRQPAVVRWYHGRGQG